MKLSNTTKIIALICANLFTFEFKSLSARILYDSNTDIISSQIVGSAFLQEDSFNDNIFSSLEANLFARKEISDDFYAKFYASATYLSSRRNDDSYSILDELYVEVDNNYGSIYIGNSPTVYYNGFPAGWLDYKLINSQHDAIDPYFYGNLFATKSASKSIFYSYKFLNFKLALQASAQDSDVIKLNDNNINLTRKHSYGLGLGYAYGPIQFGGSYINSKFEDSSDFNDDFVMNIASIGAKVNIFGIYSAIGVFYDNNRWDIGNVSYSFQYLLKYERYRLFNKMIVPQIAYSYKYYKHINEFNTTGITSNNDLYISLSYFLRDYIEVFIEGKFDMRNSFQVEEINNIMKSDKHLRYNRIGLGIKGSF